MWNDKKSIMKIKLKSTEKKNNRGGRARLLLTALLLVGSMAAHSQIGLPGGGENIPDAPIDGFLVLGLIVGTCLGLLNRRGKE